MGFQQGLSGLNAAARNLDVIGNNVANANTVGAKTSRAEFADIYANSLNGAGNNAVGIGVTVAAVAQQFTQGDIVTTNNPLDVAINGAGFFEVSVDGTKAYTRNGQFKLDAEGFITTTDGARVQGFMADANGVLTQINTDLQLRVDGVAPQVSSEAKIGLNLDSGTEPPTAAFSIEDPASYAGIASMAVYSSQGQQHTLATYYRKTGDNTWEVHASLDGTAFPANPVTTLSFDTAGKLVSPVGPLAITLPFGASEGGDTPITLDLSGITQYGSPFVVAETAQDGFSSGDLTGFSIGSDGRIEARYSNGTTLMQGQLTLVNFRNPQGLAPLGGNAWAATAESGAALTPQAPGSGNLGALQSGALEQSNVDLTAELVNMITAQRIYQANAQTIRTQDQMMQTIVNLR
jgi:flagellar hook protein FlgE